MTSAEDRVANKALQECCQDILDHINVDLVTFRLYSKSRLTVHEVSRLESIQTAQEKKKQLYILALADKGSAAYEDILQILNDTASYQPHADLADKLSKRHKCLSQRLAQSGHPSKHVHYQPQEVGGTVSTRKRKETCLESQPSGDDEEEEEEDNDDSGDNRSHNRLLSRSLPDIAIVETRKPRTTRAKQKIPPVVDWNTSRGEPAANKVLSLLVGQSTRVTQLSSSIQDTNDPTACQQPSSTPAMINTGKPVGVTSRLDQIEPTNINPVANTVTKRRGYSNSFIHSEPTILLKSSVPLQDMIHLKLILLGDSGVGKTSLAQRYLHGVYLPKSPMTVGNKLDQCYCQHVQKRTNIKLSVWDTAGQERFNWMSPIYYRNVHAAIVVFDMTDPETLRSASSWKTELSTYLSDDDANIPVLLVGNKCDSRKVNHGIRRQAQEIADRMGFDDFIEASAKTNHKVEGIFEKAVSQALEFYRPPENTNIVISSNHSQQQQQQQQRTRCKKC